MAKLSRQTKETLKTITFLVVVGLLVTAYVIYPLNRSKAQMARANVDDYSDDSLAVNDPSAYLEAGLAPDTFRIEADGLTNLACLYLSPGDTATKVKGTVFLLHDDGADRDSMVTMARRLLDSHYAVFAYDQRASGRSTGKYHGDGQYEADDIVAAVSYLNIRGQISHPLYVVGFSLGADAAILASLEEKRIDGVVAVRPYLTTTRLLDALRKRHGTFWFPLYRTMMWWWYNIRSGYAAKYRDTDNIQPVACRTLILVPISEIDEEEITRIKEISPPDLLTVEATPDDDEGIGYRIVSFLQGQ